MPNGPTPPWTGSCSGEGSQTNSSKASNQGEAVENFYDRKRFRPRHPRGKCPVEKKGTSNKIQSRWDPPPIPSRLLPLSNLLKYWNGMAPYGKGGPTGIPNPFGSWFSDPWKREKLWKLHQDHKTKSKMTISWYYPWITTITANMF